MTWRRTLISLGTGLLAAALVLPSGTSLAAAGVAPAGTAPSAAALPPLAPGDWTGSRNKAAGGGVNQAELSIRPQNAQALHIVNHIPSTATDASPQSGATGHGLLYAGLPGGGLGAYDLIGWTQKWSARLGSNLIAVDDNAVYTVAAGDSADSGGTGVAAYKPGTGAKIWRRSLPGIIEAAPPTLFGSTLYVTWAKRNKHGQATAWVTALKVTTGATIWQTQVPGGGLLSSLSASGNAGVMSVSNGVARSINLANGALGWATAREGDGNGMARPVIRGSTVYLGSIGNDLQGVVRALDLGTGAVQWSRRLTGPVFGSVVVSDGVVYAGASNSEHPGAPDLYALNADDGSVIWAVPSGVDASLSLANGVLFVPTFFGGNGMKSYDAATGAQLGQITLADRQVNTEPMISHERVYLLQNDGQLDIFGFSSQL
jgi:outer membrane protein assembly factor BamB